MDTVEVPNRIVSKRCKNNEENKTTNLTIELIKSNDVVKSTETRTVIVECTFFEFTLKFRLVNKYIFCDNVSTSLFITRYFFVQLFNFIPQRESKDRKIL